MKIIELFETDFFKVTVSDMKIRDTVVMSIEYKNENVIECTASTRAAQILQLASPLHINLTRENALKLFAALLLVLESPEDFNESSIEHFTQELREGFIEGMKDEQYTN